MAQHVSSTREVPLTSQVPRHIAVIMDGNGRWAKNRRLPRFAGHQRGVEALRSLIKGCIARRIEYLTVFAFSSENWRRPVEEVTVLRQLFLAVLKNEVSRMHLNGIRLKVIGDLSPFGAEIIRLAREGEAATERNSKLTLTVAANYGGRWDIMQAANRALRDLGGRRNWLRQTWIPISLCTMRRSRICSFAPAGSNGSATFYSGNLPTRNFTSPRRYGRILTRPHLMLQLRGMVNARGDLGRPVIK